MKKLSILILLFCVVGLVSAQTTATMDFNNFQENAVLNGQHGWVARAHSAGGGQLRTEYLSGWGSTTPDETMVWDYDLSEYLSQGGVHLFYQFDPDYVDECHPNYPGCQDGVNYCPHCTNPDNPILRVSGMMVTQANNTQVLTETQEHPDFEKDPFTIDILPNPVHGQMTIRTDYTLGRMSVHILNSYGVEVRGFVMDGQATIDVADLPAGLYFVNVIGGKVVTKKVLIQ